MIKFNLMEIVWYFPSVNGFNKNPATLDGDDFVKKIMNMPPREKAI